MNSMNPVTFTGKSNNGKTIKFSIGRLWVGNADKKDYSKRVSIVIWEGDDENPQIIRSMILDEEHLTECLKLLFPHNELSTRRVN